MPSSTYEQITAVVMYLERVMPMTVLDVGLGNGKLGFIARDLLDVIHGQRYKSDQWLVRVDGIEAFPTMFRLTNEPSTTTSTRVTPST